MFIHHLIHRACSGWTLTQFLCESFSSWHLSTWLQFWFSKKTSRLFCHNHPPPRFIIREGRWADKLTDGYAVFYVSQSQTYNPPGFEISPGSTVVDIGGHIGCFACKAATIAKSVLVYEPSSDNFRLLQQNIALNKLENVVVFPYCVAGGTGDRDFYTDRLINAMHGLYQKPHAVKTDPVRAVTLTDVLDQNAVQRCHFLKMDCEGAEYEIIQTTPLKTLKRIEKIVLEYHHPKYFGLDTTGCSLKGMKNRLRQAGFRVIIKPQNLVQGLLFADRPRAVYQRW